MHSWKFPLRWSLTKDIPLEEGEPHSPLSVAAADIGTNSHAAFISSDRGLGTSIGSGSSLDNTKPTSTRTTTTPHSLYRLRSNGGFLHRDHSRPSFDEEKHEVAGPSESSGKGITKEGR